MPRKKKTEVDSKLKEKLDYIGLDLEKIPKSLKEYSDINFRTLRGYDEKKYKQYRFIDVNDIEILLSPTNRINTIKEKYEKAMPLCYYLDSKNEENLMNFTEFLNMREQMGLAQMYDSEQIIDLFREMKEGGIDPQIIKDNFEKFLASTAGKQMRHEWDNVQDEIKDRNYKRLKNKGRPEPGRYDAEVQAKNEIKRRRAKKRNSRPAGYYETGTVQKRKEAQRQKRREAYQRRKAKSGNT